MENSDPIVVIGAGMVGVSCALHLQRTGCRVILIERNTPGSGTTYGNACTIARFGCIPINQPQLLRQLPRLLLGRRQPLSVSWSYLPKMIPWLWQFLRHCQPHHSRAISQALASLLRHAEDEALELFRAARAEHLLARQGFLSVYSTTLSYQNDQTNRQLRQQLLGNDLVELDQGEIDELEPALAGCFPHGYVYSQGFHLMDPQQMTQEMVEQFCRDGGTLICDDLHRIEHESKDQLKLSGKQATYTASQVVIAAGAWSGHFLGDTLESLPLDTERGYHVLFPDDGQIISHVIGLPDAGFFLVPMAHGLRAAGTVELAGLNAPSNPERIHYIEGQARLALPTLGRSSDTWLGFRPTLPDSLPVIGRSRHLRNVIFAFGHHHLGLTLAGITGRLVSEIATGAPPSVDLTPFDGARFR